MNKKKLKDRNGQHASYICICHLDFTAILIWTQFVNSTMNTIFYIKLFALQTHAFYNT